MYPFICVWGCINILPTNFRNSKACLDMQMWNLRNIHGRKVLLIIGIYPSISFISQCLEPLGSSWEAEPFIIWCSLFLALKHQHLHGSLVHVLAWMWCPTKIVTLTFIFLLDIFFICISNAIPFPSFLSESPLHHPLPLLRNPPTPTSWPWHSPILGHRTFTRPKTTPPID